jgi:acyl carrier protein
MTAVSAEQVLATLTQVFREVFDEEGLVLTLETTANDMEEWDSLNQIKLIIGCEKAFDIRLKPREINGLQNVGEMVDHLIRHLNA